MELPRSCDEATVEAALDEAGLLPGDCDDDDSGRHPNLTEKCGDGKDQDCDGEDAALTVVYADADLDGFGDALTSQESCESIDGYVEDGTDCDGRG